jgi:hypothetical protein
VSAAATLAARDAAPVLIGPATYNDGTRAYVGDVVTVCGGRTWWRVEKLTTIGGRPAAWLVTFGVRTRPQRRPHLLASLRYVERAA